MTESEWDAVVALRSAGYHAAANGKGFLDNPYDPLSSEGRHWLDGFVDGLKDSQDDQ